MRSPAKPLTAFVSAFALATLLACSNSMSADRQSDSNRVAANQQLGNAGVVKSSPGRPEKEELLSLIHTASLDEGPLGNEAREKLRQRDREQLVRDVTDLRDSLPEDDPQRVETALFFCTINHDYQANRKIVASAFRKDTPANGPAADDAWNMIDRLIQRGDTDLLSLGFNAVSWADGGVAEALDATFDEQLARDPEDFLKELGKQPKKVRMDVYDYILSDKNMFPKTDFAKLQKYLKSVPARSTLSTAAREFDEALSDTSKGNVNSNHK